MVIVRGVLLAACRPAADEVALRAAAQDHVRAAIQQKLDHFGAILRKEGDRYVVADPTFGTQLLFRADVLEAELSGVFLVPAGDLPAGLEARSSALIP